MKFTGHLIKEVQQRVDACNERLTDPSRLEALSRTKLMDTPNEEAFDRLAELAARVLQVPLTIISLVSDKRQFFKASYGLPPPLNVIREIPIDDSICRYTLQGEAIIVDDALTDPFLRYHPAREPWGIAAFIAIPMILPDGNVLGAFCAVNQVKHVWTAEEIYILKALTYSIMTEINLRMQLSALEKEREIRDRFVATLTHDLRTPMTAAQLNMQLLRRKVEDPEKVRNLSDKVVKNLDRVDCMIQDLLDGYRIKAGEEIPITVTECRLDQVIESTIENLTELHGARFKFENRLGAVLGYWDGGYLRRALDNLAGNAIKYGELKSLITITLQSQSQGQGQGQGIELAVHNYGEPIALADQEVLFNPFHRTSSALNSSTKGWGIGLTFVRAVAVAHHGTVNISSLPGEGTTFYVRLPVDSRAH